MNSRRSIIVVVVVLVSVFGRWQHVEAAEDLRDRSRSAGSRIRRGIIMPGTHWCGTGNVSTDGRDYGNVVATDRCCQQHDSCALTIAGFTTKYGLFNYRFHTISHCECDDV